MRKYLNLSFEFVDDLEFDLFVNFLTNYIELLDGSYYHSLKLSEIYPNGSFKNLVTSYGQSYFSEEL